MEQKIFSIKNCKHALILGLGDIGCAITRELARQNPGCRIFATKRVSSPTPENLPESVRVLDLDPISERSWQYFIKSVLEETETLDLVISTFGVLHNEHLKPEKKLEDITIESMRESFSINAFTAALAGKNLIEFLKDGHPSLMAFLSAKVGSIADDKMGGWYSYRSSKAALNMIVKNMAIEFQHRSINAITLAIHPGTTLTKLSRPYLGHTSKPAKSPEETAANILKLIEGVSPKTSGCFESWDGSELPY